MQPSYNDQYSQNTDLNLPQKLYQLHCNAKGLLVLYILVAICNICCFFAFVSWVALVVFICLSFLFGITAFIMNIIGIVKASHLPHFAHYQSRILILEILTFIFSIILLGFFAWTLAIGLVCSTSQALKEQEGYEPARPIIV